MHKQLDLFDEDGVNVESTVYQEALDILTAYTNDLPHIHEKRRKNIYHEISDELDRAYAKHGKEMWNRHEFYSIMLEEVDEVWDDIKSNKPFDILRKEIIQVAAMCVRFLEQDC